MGRKIKIIRNDEDRNTGYFLEVDVEYSKKLSNRHRDLPFLPEREKVEKIEKRICSIEDKENMLLEFYYFILSHDLVLVLRVLKQALNHGLKLKKVHTVIQFKQGAWLKSNIVMNTELRTEPKKKKKKIEIDFLKLINNYVFGKTMENVRNHGDIKLVTSDETRKRLVSELNYHSHKIFSEHLMAIEMKKTRVEMIKPIYLGMSILNISKMIMYEFWYGYIKPKYGERAKLCYTDTNSFVIHIKTEDFFEDISNDVEKWFDTSNYDEKDERLLPIGKNKRIPGIFKDELGGKIMVEVVALRPKA